MPLPLASAARPASQPDDGTLAIRLAPRGSRSLRLARWSLLRQADVQQGSPASPAAASLTHRKTISAFDVEELPLPMIMPEDSIVRRRCADGGTRCTDVFTCRRLVYTTVLDIDCDLGLHID